MPFLMENLDLWIKLQAAAKKARVAHVPSRLVDQAIAITTLELQEDSRCPVPHCLAALLETAATDSSEGEDAVRELAFILDGRDAYFSGSTFTQSRR